jgi:DNA-binding PadR family transcriptional regulator
MSLLPALSLAEWTVLTIISEQPTHGFAIARLTAPDGELGRVWQMHRPVVYRAIGRLAEAGLIMPAAVESGRGPQRTVYRATPAGAEAAREWLRTPVPRIHEVRSDLLLKLALISRTGGDPAPLLQRQRAAFEPVARAIGEQPATSSGFEAMLHAWRRAAASATMSFLDEVTGPASPHGAPAAPRQLSRRLTGQSRERVTLFRR